MIPQHQHRRNSMTLATNDDFANCELSAEELEAIAAGWPHWLKTVVHDIGKAAEYAAPYVPFVLIGAILGAGASNAQTHYTSLGGYPL
jgi:hypothetical protein